METWFKETRVQLDASFPLFAAASHAPRAATAFALNKPSPSAAATAAAAASSSATHSVLYQPTDVHSLLVNKPFRRDPKHLRFISHKYHERIETA
jgi:hypothetical protein